MHIHANSIQYPYAQMQALMAVTPSGAASKTSAAAPTDSAAGQDVPGEPTAQTSAAAMPSPPLPSQPAPGGTPSGQFASDTLASLISLQTSLPGASATHPASAEAGAAQAAPKPPATLAAAILS
jgi:hypothetical protein